jgi:hypothetical protein
MCPAELAAASLIIGTASAGANFAMQDQAAANANTQANLAHRNASLAAQRQYESGQANMIAETRDAQQKGYESALRGRESVSSAKASSSFTGVTMDNILDAEHQKAAFNANKASNYISDVREKYIRTAEDSEAQAQGRIDATPFKDSASVLNLGLDIGKTVIGTASSNPEGMKKLFGYS